MSRKIWERRLFFKLLFGGLLILSSLIWNGAAAQETLFEGFASRIWGYPISTEHTRSVSSDERQLAGRILYQVVRPRPFLPSLSFLLQPGDRESTKMGQPLDWTERLESPDLGLYLSFQPAGNIYFHGLVRSDLDSFAEGLDRRFGDSHNLDFQYRGTLGITLGRDQAFNLQLQFLGTRLSDQLDSVSIGARYSF